MRKMQKKQWKLLRRYFLDSESGAIKLLYKEHDSYRIDIEDIFNK